MSPVELRSVGAGVSAGDPCAFCGGGGSGAGGSWLEGGAGRLLSTKAAKPSLAVGSGGANFGGGVCNDAPAVTSNVTLNWSASCDELEPYVSKERATPGFIENQIVSNSYCLGRSSPARRSRFLFLPSRQDLPFDHRQNAGLGDLPRGNTAYIRKRLLTRVRPAGAFSEIAGKVREGAPLGSCPAIPAMT